MQHSQNNCQIYRHHGDNICPDDNQPPSSRLGSFVFVRCYESIRKNFIIFKSFLCEPAGEDRPAGVPGEDSAALIVAVGVVRQAHCAVSVGVFRNQGHK